MRTIQTYLRRLGWLGALSVVLVIAGAVLFVYRPFLAGATLILVAVVPLIPKALKWIEESRKEEKEKRRLLRINRPITGDYPHLPKRERIVHNKADKRERKCHHHQLHCPKSRHLHHHRGA